MPPMSSAVWSVLMLIRQLLAFAVLCLVASLSLPLHAAEPAESLAEQLPRIVPTEADATASTFELQDGFRMELAASEPMVVDPVDAAFDEQGRLWVVEMRGYPFPEARPIGRVRLLTDADDDGRFDRADIVAEELFWPTGIAVWNGGVFVIAAPDLWYIKDTDGDGKANIKEVIYTGFGHDNVQALANNLKWGFDGWIYGAAASNGGDIVQPENPKLPAVSIRGRDFRFDPRNHRFEALGGSSQFGQCFSDGYDRFLCSNSDHAIHVVMPPRYLDRPGVAGAGSDVRFSLLASIAVEGGAGPVFRRSLPEPWRVLRTARRAASGQPFPTSELHAQGYFTSASGITIYRGDAYPEAFRGDLFVGDVGGNLIHRKKIDEASATYRAKAAYEGVEFLASTDNWFRPVNFVNAPDGTLYVLDMYRETIEHPWSIPEDIKAHLDLENGRDRGRIYRLAPPGFVRRPTPNLGALSVPEWVDLLAHSNAWHRETAERMLIEHADAQTPDLVRGKLSGSSAEGSLHALGLLAALDALTEADLLTALASPHPRVREQALRFAESKLNESATLRDAAFALAKDPSFRVRWQLALSLGACSDPRRPAMLLGLVESDGKDSWMRGAILASSHDVAGFMLRSLTEKGASKNWANLVGTLAAMIARSSRADDRAAALQALALLVQQANRDEALAVLAPLAPSLTNQEQSSASTSEALRRSLDWAQEVAFANGAPVESRIHGIEILASLKPTMMDRLAELLSNREPIEVQIAAVNAIGLSSDDSAGRRLISRWAETGPIIHEKILLALLTKDRHADLLDALEAGQIPAREVSSSHRDLLSRRGNDMIKSRVEKVFGAVATDRQQVIATYAPALEGKPDLAAGEKVFVRECATCHQLGTVGHPVGPNLATIRGRTPRQMLDHILDPNIEVQPSFVEFTVALDDGRVLTGMVGSESESTFVLSQAGGNVHSIQRSQVEEMKSSGKSLMPVGLEQKVTPEEMASLIAFLLSKTDTSSITGTRK